MKKIIINADDFGESIEKNAAIEYCFHAGYITSSTIMANGECFGDAIERVKKNNFSNIGIHINIFDGESLTDDIKECKRFYNKGKFDYKLKMYSLLTRKEKNALIKEFDAQILKVSNALEHELTHGDSHHHTHFNIFILPLLSRVLKKNNINKIRICGRGKTVLGKIHYIMFRLMINKKMLTPDYFSWFGDKVNKDNVVNEIMCHPIMNSYGLVVNKVSNIPADKCEKMEDLCSKIDVHDQKISYREL